MACQQRCKRNLVVLTSIYSPYIFDCHGIKTWGPDSPIRNEFLRNTGIHVVNGIFLQIEIIVLPFGNIKMDDNQCGFFINLINKH